MHQNVAFPKIKFQNFLERGIDLTPVGRGYPLPTPHTLDAFGGSVPSSVCWCPSSWLWLATRLVNGLSF